MEKIHRFVLVANAKINRVPPWVIYLLSFAYIVWLFVAALTGHLGVRPVENLIFDLGETGLQAPLRRFTPLNLMKFRRAIGVSAFTFIFMHATVWSVLEIGNFLKVFKLFTEKNYLIAGGIAATMMLALAITSNNRMVKKLGVVKWRKLHKLVYPMAFVAALHYVLLAKGNQIEPKVYMAIIVFLLALRLIPKRKPQAKTPPRGL